MTHDTRTSDDIEREISKERSQLSSSMNALQQKFSGDAIVDDLGHIVRDLGGDVSRTLRQTVGRNPAAVAVVGVGLAWLFLGGNRSQSSQSADARSDPGFASQRHSSQWDSGGLPTDRAREGTLYDDSAWFRDGPSARGRGGHAASHRGNGMFANASAAVGDATNSMSHAASDLTEQLSHGLHDLSDKAKARVLAARRAAHDARQSSGAAMGARTEAATDFFKEQPLVVGALAVAFGAAIGSMLPHSRMEDDTMGASSDQLYRDAQAVFREERDKAMAVVKGAAHDVQDEMSDIGSDLRSEAEELLPEDKNLGAAVVDRAADAATRVVDGAKDRAERQNLGRRDN